MRIKYSVISLLLGLFSFFLLQVFDRLKDVMLIASTVDTDESTIDQSLLTSNLVIIPIIFLILSVFFYYYLPEDRFPSIWSLKSAECRLRDIIKR